MIGWAKQTNLLLVTPEHLPQQIDTVTIHIRVFVHHYIFHFGVQ